MPCGAAGARRISWQPGCATISSTSRSRRSPPSTLQGLRDSRNCAFAPSHSPSDARHHHLRLAGRRARRGGDHRRLRRHRSGDREASGGDGHKGLCARVRPRRGARGGGGRGAGSRRRARAHRRRRPHRPGGARGDRVAHLRARRRRARRPRLVVRARGGLLPPAAAAAHLRRRHLRARLRGVRPVPVDLPEGLRVDRRAVHHADGRRRRPPRRRHQPGVQLAADAARRVRHAGVGEGDDGVHRAHVRDAPRAAAAVLQRRLTRLHRHARVGQGAPLSMAGPNARLTHTHLHAGL